MYGDNEIGNDGLTKRERKLQEDSKTCDKMMDEIILKQIENIGFEEAGEAEQRDDSLPKDASRARRVRAPSTRIKQTSNISTVRARDAAAALSGTERSLPRTRQAVNPKVKPRVTSSLFSSRKPRAPTNPSSMRHTAAAASSRTTVGYTKGRDVSSKLHGKPSDAVGQPIAKGILSPETYVQPAKVPSETELDAELGEPATDAVPSDVENVLPTYEEDEETQNFQLTL